MVEQLAAAGLFTSEQTAERAGTTLPRLMNLITVGAIFPRPKRVGRAFLWTLSDVERARQAVDDMKRKREESKKA